MPKLSPPRDLPASESVELTRWSALSRPRVEEARNAIGNQRIYICLRHFSRLGFVISIVLYYITFI